MAVTYSTPGAPVRITLSGTPDVATQVSFSDRVRVVEVRFLDASNAPLTGKVARTGTDNAAIVATSAFVASGATKRVIVSSGRSRAEVLGGFSLYLASVTASAVVEVTGLVSEHA